MRVFTPGQPGCVGLGVPWLALAQRALAKQAGRHAQHGLVLAFHVDYAALLADG